jgi:hypothetical protein
VIRIHPPQQISMIPQFADAPNAASDLIGNQVTRPTDPFARILGFAGPKAHLIPPRLIPHRSAPADALDS